MDSIREELTGALIGLARATDGNTHPTERTYQLLRKGLLAAVGNDELDKRALQSLIEEVRREKGKLVPRCSNCASPCGRNDDYDMAKLRDDREDIRALKVQILAGAQQLAANACQTKIMVRSEKEVDQLLAKALFTIGEDEDAELLLPIAQEIERIIYNAKGL